MFLPWLSYLRNAVFFLQEVDHDDPVCGFCLKPRNGQRGEFCDGACKKMLQLQVNYPNNNDF